MNILIKGIEMPKTGELLCLDILPDGKVYIHLDLENKPIATAVPIPPHGRLGDLDELEKTFREDADFEWNRFVSPANWADAFDDVADMIADAPTIIEAEDEE